MASSGNDKSTVTDKNSKTEVEDDELNSLLDSALEDFEKPLVLNTEKNVATANPESSIATGAGSEAKPNSGANINNSANVNITQFEEAMKSFLDEDPAFKEQMQKLADAALSGPGADDEAFAASLAETLKGIADNAQTLSENPSEEELSRVLGNLGLGNQGGGDLPDLIPLMQNVMQSLLSKDLLYPALKEIVDKYPDWLTEKQSTLDVASYEKYSNQYELMKRVCDEFDTERTTDTDQIKTARFERILQLMQKMQECGHPPKELVGELGPDVPLDADGNLKLPGMSGEQCSIM